MGSLMIGYLMSFIGTPYHYGGDNAIQGFDCSGLVSEGLRSIGLCGKEKLNAQKIYDKIGKFKKVYLSEVHEGDLLFFGSSPINVTHVAVAISMGRMLEAGGGDAGTVSPKIATETDAMVRIRPITWRRDLIGVKSLD